MTYKKCKALHDVTLNHITRYRIASQHTASLLIAFRVISSQLIASHHITYLYFKNIDTNELTYRMLNVEMIDTRGLIEDNKRPFSILPSVFPR